MHINQHDVSQLRTCVTIPQFVRVVWCNQSTIVLTISQASCDASRGIIAHDMNNSLISPCSHVVTLPKKRTQLSTLLTTWTFSTTHELGIYLPFQPRGHFLAVSTSWRLIWCLKTADRDHIGQVGCWPFFTSPIKRKKSRLSTGLAT